MGSDDRGAGAADAGQRPIAHDQNRTLARDKGVELSLGAPTIGLMSFRQIYCLFSAQQVNELMQKIHKLTDN